MNELTLQALKEKADLLGITYHPNIGIESLRAKINAKMEDAKTLDAPGEGPALSKAETEHLLRTRLHAEQMRLVRLRISNMDPKKKDLHGEIISVSNRYLGTVKKFIPFGEATDNGYHVPFILYNEMKNKRFLQIKTRKGPNGQLMPESKLVPEYALEVLEPLTAKELAELKAQQQATAGL